MTTEAPKCSRHLQQLSDNSDLNNSVYTTLTHSGEYYCCPLTFQKLLSCWSAACLREHCWFLWLENNPGLIVSSCSFTTQLQYTQWNTFGQILLPLTSLPPSVSRVSGLSWGGKQAKQGSEEEQKRGWDNSERNHGDTVERGRNPGRGIKAETHIEGGEVGRERQRELKVGMNGAQRRLRKHIWRGNEVGEMWLQRD